MLNIKQLRKIDPTLKDLNDEEVENIKESYYELGQLIRDVWLKEKNG